MLRLMREPTKQRSCRCFQEEKISLTIYYKSHCGPATGCECTAETRRTFHWSLLNHFSWWGCASKHHKVLSTSQKTYRVTSRKSQHQMGHRVSTPLHVTCEEYSNFHLGFCFTGHGQLLNYPEPALLPRSSHVSEQNLSQKKPL